MNISSQNSSQKLTTARTTSAPTASAASTIRLSAARLTRGTNAVHALRQHLLHGLLILVHVAK